MCACRCGIDVHLQDGAVKYIEGNRDHPVNQGVLCAKGSAGIMQHLSPARLRAPMRRTGPRGSGQFEEISWDEALDLAASWLGPIREEAPEKLAFFTGRDQSQSFTGWWAQQFGTPNYAAHGGFCSVNMAAGGHLHDRRLVLGIRRSPDWEHSKYFLMFGVAEDHDSNPIKLGLAKLKGERCQVRLGQPGAAVATTAIADEWVAITPGSGRALLILSPGARIADVGRQGRSRIPGALHQRRPSGSVRCAIPGGDDDGLFCRDDADGQRSCVWDPNHQGARQCAVEQGRRARRCVKRRSHLAVDGRQGGAGLSRLLAERISRRALRPGGRGRTPPASPAATIQAASPPSLRTSAFEAANRDRP